MKHLLTPVNGVLTALALLALAPPVGAQQPPQDLVPMKMTLTFPLPQPRFDIPVSPPIRVAVNATTGVDPDLGSFNYIETATVYLGVDGKPVRNSGGVSALTATNGDAIFASYGGIFVPPTAPYIAEYHGTFTITGGRGRYLGATGSGTLLALHDPAKNVVICTMEGMITRPKQ